MKKTVLITGATSGIGEATARAFADEGYRLVITGRRSERLQALKTELQQTFDAEVCVTAFDIRESAMCQAAIEALPEKFAAIDVLVNNAGLASGLEHLDQGALSDWNTMIDTNIKVCCFSQIRHCLSLECDYPRTRKTDISLLG